MKLVISQGHKKLFYGVIGARLELKQHQKLELLE